RLLVGALVEAEGEREAALLLLHLQGLHRDLELEVLVHDGLQHLAQEDGEKRVVHLAEAVHGVEVREAHDLQRVVLAALRDVDLLGVAHGLQAAVELVQRADGLLALGRESAALVAVLQHAQRGVLHHVAAREAERRVDRREEAVGHGADHLVVHVPGLGRRRGRGQAGGGLFEGPEDGRRGEARRRDGLLLGGLGGGRRLRGRGGGSGGRRGRRRGRGRLGRGRGRLGGGLGGRRGLRSRGGLRHWLGRGLGRGRRRLLGRSGLRGRLGLRLGGR